MCGKRAGLLLICACSALTLLSDRVPLSQAPAAAAALATGTPAASRAATPVAKPSAKREANQGATYVANPGGTHAANHVATLVASYGGTLAAGPIPRLEPLAHHANRPYRQAGRDYRPMKNLQPFRQRGMASWYGAKFHGRKTAVGERYDMNSMSAAHPTLPLPSYVRVTTLKDRKSVIVRVNDRGPFAHGRVIDLSHAAARHLGILQEGTAAVELDLIVPGSAEKKMPAGEAGMH